MKFDKEYRASKIMCTSIFLKSILICLCILSVDATLLKKNHSYRVSQDSSTSKKLDSSYYSYCEFCILTKWCKPNKVKKLALNSQFTSHSAYVAGATESVGVKIDGLLPPIFCSFRKCKQKVPRPSLLINDFEKSRFFQNF